MQHIVREARTVEQHWRSGEARDKAACPTRVRFEKLSSNQIT